MNMNQNLGTSTCNSSTNMSQMSQMHRSSSTLTNLTDNTNNGSLIHSSLPSLVQTSYHDQSNNLLDHNTPLYSAYYPYSYSMQNNNSQIDNLGIQNNKNYNHHINYQNTNNLYMNQMEVPHPSYFEEVTPNQINNKQSTNNTQTNMNMNLHTSFYGQTDPQIDTCHPYYYSNYNLNHTGIGYVNQITNTNQTYSNSPSIGISAKERKEKMKPSVNDFLLESDGLE